jgi:hypothetical protein
MIFAGIPQKVSRGALAWRPTICLIAISIAGSAVPFKNQAVAADISEMCFGLTFESPDPDGIQLRIARVVGDARAELSFVLPPSCERDPESCRGLRRSSAQPGDTVIVGRQAFGFVCSHRFDGASHADGWLPLSRLKIEEPTQVAAPLSAWAGTWRGEDNDATITIDPAEGGGLRVVGDAMWQGAHGPPHVGEFGTTARPAGSLLALIDSDCHVSLFLLPGSLAVIDNAQCGGLNVRFSGFYVRAPRSH